MVGTRWSFRFIATALVAALAVTAVAGSSNGDTTIAPSAMGLNPSGAGRLVADRGAGTVLMIWSNGGFAVPLTTGGSGAGLAVTARADNCSGSPILAVKRRGATVASVAVTSTSWARYVVDLHALTGTGPVTLEYVNDYRGWFCDRNVYVAGVTVRDGAGTPTPIPPTTPPTTTPSTPSTTPTTPTAPSTTTTPPTNPGTNPGTDPSTGCPVNQFQARYFNNVTASGSPVATRCENAPGGSFTAAPLNGVNADNFSVDYNGVLDFAATQQHTLSVTLGNVGARVWFDDQLVIDKWTPQWGTTNVQRTVTAGRHRVRATYFATGGIAHFGMAVPRSTPGAPSNNGNYFAADSFWNTAVPAGAPVDPRSPGWVSALDGGSSGISVNSRDWSTTVYNAPPGTPTQQVLITNTNKRLTIPYLSTYRPTQDGDAHLAVIDDATGCLYEFQGFNPWNGSAIASATYRVYTGSGGHVAGPKHAGGEFSYLAGLITPQDVQAGVIDHALRYAMPGSSPNYVFPGTQSDGTDLAGVPQGTRLQLDPTLDLSRFGLSPFQLMVARALQTYGGFNADHSSVFTLYARSPLDGTTYTQPIQPLPDALIAHVRFLAPTIASNDVYLDRADDPMCNQQR